MAGYRSWFLDRNNDGFPDDISCRFLIDPSNDIDQQQFWSELIDFAAQVGLDAQALPLPLFVTDATSVVGIEHLKIRSPNDLGPLREPGGEAERVAAQPSGQVASADLLDLFLVGWIAGRPRR